MAESSDQHADAEGPAAWRRWSCALACALLVLATVLAFHRALAGPAIFDDLDLIGRNPSINDLSNLRAVLNPPVELPSSGRPAVNLSLAINHAIHGQQPMGYKAVNLALHVLNVLLVFAVLRAAFVHAVGSTAESCATAFAAMLRRHGDTLAFAITLLWALHPLHTETIAYISQRTELMMSLGLLGALYCTQRGLSADAKQPRLWQAGAVASAALSMLSKEVAVVIPVVIYCYDALLITGSFREAWRRHQVWHLSLCAIWLLLLWTYHEHPRPHSTGLSSDVSSWDYLLTQSQVIVLYLKLTFWPDPLAIAYDWPIVSHWRQALFTGPAVLAIVVLTAAGLFRQSRLSMLGVWFLLILAPSSSVVPILTEVVAERRMYLPLIAVLTLLALGIAGLAGRIAALRASERATASPAVAAAVTLGLAIVLTIALGWRSHHRLHDYRSDLAIWHANIEDHPPAWRPHHNLATIYMDRGEPHQALHHIEQALALQGDKPHVNSLIIASFIYRSLGHIEQAAKHIEQAHQLDPQTTEQQLRAYIGATRR